MLFANILNRTKTNYCLRSSKDLKECWGFSAPPSEPSALSVSQSLSRSMSNARSPFSTIETSSLYNVKNGCKGQIDWYRKYVNILST